jgi:hypothetical protein
MVMGATSDQASSMTKALETFEGAPCVDHKIQNAMKHASRGAFITQLEKSCRGMVAHFRRSSKVIKHKCRYFISNDVKVVVFHTGKGCSSRFK